ncbi:hypothetical protein HYT04_00665 [Candidatus Kaiserbacteria bacterium]|nr:hypothetical protein [Candidatus Kaiserbacteria bacterium]
MVDQPLQPFSPPTALLTYVPDGITAAVAVEWLLYAVFAFWAIYTLIAVYHWLKYSHASWVAFPAIATHLFVSFVLIAYALSGELAVSI